MDTKLGDNVFTKEVLNTLGSRGIRFMLLNQGIKVGHYLVRKLMRESDLVYKQQKKHRYQNHVDETHAVSNILNRQFKPTQPNHVWSSDITYIWTGKRWAYLAVVLDLYARRVIGWSMSAQANQHLVLKALDKAWHRRGKPTGIIFHSDQGSQYKGLLVKQRLKCYAMQQSLSRKGNCWDNTPTERLF